MEYSIDITNLTGGELARKACQFTLHSQLPTKIPMDKLYKSEHSPIRTQLFWIEMMGIPSFVSVHLTRHKLGVEHFVQTQRDDRGADAVADRNTPVNHAMLINAQALINMSRKRLCLKSHYETCKVMHLIKKTLRIQDNDLAECMLPECLYRNGCNEPKTCGGYPKWKLKE